MHSRSTVKVTIRKCSGRLKELTKKNLMHLNILLRLQPLLPMAVNSILFCEALKKVAF